MAYNSDGYIMIDFTEVDFRRTNQTIDGLYKRCVDVIGTNKFILVINANGRTPLPATCSFTNNQYVIDTVIYMFAVSSNDNLFIRRNDVPASDIIDDSSISVDKTWSSNKIDTELDGKADASALAEYQPLLTPVSPVSINADNEISVDLSGKQDKLTAGDNISIVNNVISAVGIKSFKYVGNGTDNPVTITFPIKPTIVLQIYGSVLGYANYSDMFFNVSKASCINIMSSVSYNSNTTRAVHLNWVNDTTLEISGENAQRAFNNNNSEYFVYYI